MVAAASSGCWSKNCLVPPLGNQPLWPIGMYILSLKVCLIKKLRVFSDTSRYFLSLVIMYPRRRASGRRAFEYVRQGSNHSQSCEWFFSYRSMSFSQWCFNTAKVLGSSHLESKQWRALM